MCGHPDRHVFRISRGINVGYSRERGPLHTSAKIAGRVRSPFNVLASQARLSA